MKHGATLTAAALASVTLALAGPSFAQEPAPKPRPAVDISKTNTLYLVGYAHLDTQWRWAYPQVIREFIRDTMRNNFALMEQYPDYVFNFSGSRRYEMMKEYYPEDYLKVKQYVKQGRWFPAGSSVDEGDANVPSAESVIRHTLYGNHFFKREFGVASREFMLPDCFGFPYSLPTILTHCGVTGFSTQKLTWGSAVGIPFKVGMWEGPDGKQVIAALDPGAYTGDVNEDLSQNTSWLARIENTGKTSGAYVDYHYYGVGDRGGAPGASSVTWVEKSVAGTGPVKVISSKSDEMFRAITPEQKAKLPLYKGEMLLTEHSAGSITSEAYMKRWNRKNEQLADSAERAAVAAMWLGGPQYPSNRLYQAWNLVLGSQMHDILPGTSLPKAYEYSWNDEVLALNQFAAIENDSIAAITSAMDTRVQGMPLVVYNPLSVARQDTVEATVPITGGAKAGVQVYGPDGKPVPTQILSRSGNTAQILFVAQVPSTSLTTFAVRAAPLATGTGTLSVSKNRLENERFRVTLDDNGDIASIYDKVNRQEAMKAPARLALQSHNPGQFPAWNMDWADAQKPPRAYVGGPVTMRVVEAGPVRVAIEIERETDGSRYVQHVRLCAGQAGQQVEVANQIDWQTGVSALKASFPFMTGNPKATYDLQAGAIERTNNDPRKYEVPQHMWFDLTKPDSSYGVAVLNEGKYGSDKPDDDTVRLTLLYTPGVRGGYQDQATQDFGRHDIRYAVAPHAGDWRKGDVAWLAKRFNRPLTAFMVPTHAGTLGKTFSLVSINSKQVEISAIKKAEDSNEIIVRLRELHGKPATGLQIKMAGQIVSAREVNGQEYPVGAATVQNGVLTTSVPGYGLRAFAITLAKSPTKATPVQTRAVTLAYDVDAVSSDKTLTDGAFDKDGRTFAAEQLPGTLLTGDVPFKFGSTATGAKNALTCKGQTLTLPAGYSRVYLLAASSDGDARAAFTLGGRAVSTTVENWGGYVGQWDNRVWMGEVPELSYDWHNEWGGLEPGYIKRGEVAWFSSHRHHPTEGNEYYQYSYLFKYGFDVPQGAKTIKLPNDPRIKIFAMTVAKETGTNVVAAAPLYDALKDRDGGRMPRILPAGGSFSDVTLVRLGHPLYWRAGGLHYTLDGSNPTASSPVYTKPLELNAPTTVKVAEVDEQGTVGPVASAMLDIKDTTAPRVVGTEVMKGQSQVTLMFSENLDSASASQAANYRLESGAQVTSATLGADKRSVHLTLDRAATTGTPTRLTVSGVKDASVGGNASPAATVDLVPLAPVFASEPNAAATPRRVRIADLPTRGTAPWTMNLLVKVDQQPEDRTLIAGFGRPTDGGSGTGRYFAKFADGIRFWSANHDVIGNAPLDLGKWQMLTATFDGSMLRLYKNGSQIAEKAEELSNDRPEVNITPKDAWEGKRVLAGEVRNMTVWTQALTPASVQQLWEQNKAQ